MASSRLLRGFAAPTAALAATLLLLAWLSRLPGFLADKLLLALAAAGLVWLIWARTQRTNRLLARFVAALAHGDLQQGFRTSGHGAALDELAAALDEVLRRLRTERQAQAGENRYAAALVDEAPTPLLAVDEAGAVQLANKAARRLFREADGRPAAAFARYGGEFATLLATAAPGARCTCRVRWDGLWQRAVVAVAQADRGAERRRIVSVQIIQGELDRAELATQTDLVRVLTHEIMNSLTPVTSLAHTAAKLLGAGGAGSAADWADARAAVGALGRRADAITAFVDSYRDFTDAPAVTIRRFDAVPWLRDLMQAFEATPQAAGIRVTLDLPGTRVPVEGDANLLGQVVLNLLKNAGQACAAAGTSGVAVTIGTNEGDRVLLQVSDDGAGVPPELAEEIFLPFFTTKASGTGVGLSFARQIVLLHGGTIGLGAGKDAGATFQIVLPGHRAGAAARPA